MRVPETRRIAVIGGGISGLAAAHRFRELGPPVRLRSLRPVRGWGGVVSTVHRDGFQVEQSADNFITTVPWGLDLCQRLGLTGQLVQTNANCRRTFVVRRGRLHRLPDGFMMMAPTQLWPMAVTPILSPLGKLRAALEYFIPPRARRRRREHGPICPPPAWPGTFDRLVEPLVSAVYAADMEKLSVKATLSRFREMEKQHGSLIRAMRRQMKHRPGTGTRAESGARYSMFVTLVRRLSTLVEAITARLPPRVDPAEFADREDRAQRQCLAGIPRGGGSVPGIRCPGRGRAGTSRQPVAGPDRCRTGGGIGANRVLGHGDCLAGLRPAAGGPSAGRHGGGGAVD